MPNRPHRSAPVLRWCYLVNPVRGFDKHFDKFFECVSLFPRQLS
jgi:hypothetical protein